MGQREEAVLQSVRESVPFEQGLFTIVRAGSRRRGEHDPACLFLALLTAEVDRLSARDRQILKAILRVGAEAVKVAEELRPDRPERCRGHVTRRKQVFSEIVKNILVRLAFIVAKQSHFPPEAKDL